MQTSMARDKEGTMSNISEVTANNTAAAMGAAGSSGANETSRTSGNYGKTFGKPKLSEEGAKYYEELKKKYSGMDFVLVSKDMKDYAKANASSFGNSSKMVVLIDEEKIERMATDEQYRAKYEGLIANAQSKMPQLKSALQNKSGVKAVGMQVNDNGTASFFAVMSKSTEDITHKLQEKRAAKKKAEKAAEKKEAKREQMEKLREKAGAKSEDARNVEEDEDYEILQADSIEELMRKIDDYSFSLRADSVQTPYEKSIGQSIDFRG